MRIAIFFAAWATFFNSTAPGLEGAEAMIVAAMIAVAFVLSLVCAVVEDCRKAFGNQ